MLVWNIDGLYSKLDEPEFLSLLMQFSYICLCETFLTFADLSSLLPDYVCYFSPAKKLSSHGRMSGGVVCLIHRSFDKFFDRIDCTTENVVVFRVCKSVFNIDRNLIMFNAYIPPAGSPYYETTQDANGIEILEKCIIETQEEHSEEAILLCGDFNARTGILNSDNVSDLHDVRCNVAEESRYSHDKTVNWFGHSLISLCSGMELSILNGSVDKTNSEKFTFISHNGCSVVDYCIATDDIASGCHSFEIGESVLSPHMLLKLKFNCNVAYGTDSCGSDRNVTKIIWDSNSAELYTSNLQEQLLQSNICEHMQERTFDVDTCTEIVTSCLVNAADFLKKSFVQGRNKLRNKWYDQECHVAKKVASKRLRSFLHTRIEQDRHAYIKSRNAYKSLLRLKKRDYRYAVTENIIRNAHDAKLFWKQIKSINGKCNVKNQILPEVWVSHFQEVFAGRENVNYQSIQCTLTTVSTDNAMLNSEISIDDINGAIKQLRPGKSPGLDQVLGEMLKCSRSLMLPCLHRLFNAIFNQGNFPALWSQSLIVPIHKKGSFTDPDNYRGITLTSILSKIFLHVINARLQLWADDNEIIGDEQAGCRKGHSTVDNVFIVHSIVQKYLFRHKKLYVLFVDFKKAFDSVNRQALWFILEQYGIGGKMLKLLKSMYESVRCCVRCQSETSAFFESCCGLKQGCKLSPLCFSYLVSYLTTEINKNGKHGVQLLPNDAEIFTLLFVDDILLLSDTVVGLQNQIDNLKIASERLGLAVNTQKTKVVVFRNGGFLAGHEKWTLGDTALEVVPQYKYLGLILSTKLCTNTVLSDLACKGKAAALQVIRTLKKLAVVSPDIVFKIFDAQVQPVLLYGSEIWGLYSCKTIESVHLYFLKWYLNVAARTPNVMVYGETGRYPLEINARLRAVKYWLKIMRMDVSRFPYKAYQMMYSMSDSQMNWVSYLKKTLLEHGFENAWTSQRVENDVSFLRSLKSKMIDRFNADWVNNVQGSSRYAFYKLFKPVREVDFYFTALDKKIFRDTWVRFRLGISDLYVHKFRYCSQSHPSVCPLCMEAEEDEMHFLFHCPALYDLRQKYILPCISNIESDLVQCIFASKETRTIRSASTFLYHAFKRRTEAVEILDANARIFIC